MTTEEIERELTLASWRAVRPLFLALVLVLVCIWAATARSATVQLTCTAPTKNIDGTPITAALSYRAYWGTSGGSLTNVVTLAGPGCAGPVVVPDPAAGTSVTYSFAVTAIANGMESAKSSIATKALTTPVPTPEPPTALTAAAGTAAYTIKPDYTTFGPMLVSSKVGTVRTETACSARQRISGTDYYRVPKTAVAFLGAAKDYVVAKCVQS